MIGQVARSGSWYGPIRPTGIGWNPSLNAGDSGLKTPVVFLRRHEKRIRHERVAVEARRLKRLQSLELPGHDRQPVMPDQVMVRGVVVE